MEKEIQDLLDLGIIHIEPSISSYSSPVMLVPKKDGLVSFDINFQKLNKITEFDKEYMPNREEVMMSKQSECKYFTLLEVTLFETP